MKAPICGRVAARALSLGLVALLSVATSVAGQSAEKVMEKMADLDIDFVGVATDIPDRQNLGWRESPQGGTTVYAWDEKRTPDDRSAREHLLTVEHLQAAGIPAVRGSAPEFEGGMFGPQRYRLGGILKGLDIQGDARYEVRSDLSWQLYDTESSSVIWEGSSAARTRGAVLGDRGEADNVLLNGVLRALDSVLDDEIPAAIEDNE